MVNLTSRKPSVVNYHLLLAKIEAVCLTCSAVLDSSFPESPTNENTSY